MSRSTGLILLLTATLLAAGCSNTSGPHPIEGDDTPDFPPRTTPDNVIARLEWAYDNMDLEIYLDCLGDDFQFYTTEADQADTVNPLPAWWDKAEEEVIHTAMFGDDSEIGHFSLTLFTEWSVYDPGVPVWPDGKPEVWLHHVDANLRMVLYDGVTANGYICNKDQDITFKIEPDSLGPGGETLWEITSWRELDERPPIQSEYTSWGQIKGMFR